MLNNRIIATMTLLLSVSFSALAEEQPNNIDAELDLPPYRAVGVITRTGNIPEAKEARILEIITARLQTSFLTSFSKQLYARGERWANAPYAPKPLQLLGDTMATLDKLILEDMQTELGKIVASLGMHEHWEITLDFIWVPVDYSERTDSPVFAVDQMPMFGPSVEGILGATLFEHIFLIPRETANALPLILIDANQGAVPKAAQVHELYEWLADGNQENTMPLRGEAQFAIQNQTLGFSFSTDMKPAMTYQAAERDGPVLVEGMSYQPGFFGDRPGLHRIMMYRNYQALTPQRSRPYLKMVFGYLDQQGLFRQCYGTSCINYVRKVPTIVAKPNPDDPLLDRFGLRSISRYLEGSTKFYLLLLDLKFDLSHPGGARISYQGSDIPLVVRWRDYLRNDRYLYIEQDRSIYGFNIYERLVGNQVTDGLSGEMGRAVRAADKAAQRDMEKSLEPLLPIIMN